MVYIGICYGYIAEHASNNTYSDSHGIRSEEDIRQVFTEDGQMDNQLSGRYYGITQVLETPSEPVYQLILVHVVILFIRKLIIALVEETSII